MAEEPEGYELDKVAVVAFHVGEREYGIEIGLVREIHRAAPVRRLPHVPHYVSGVINLRGQLLPIVDLRTRFGMARAEPTRRTRIVVAEAGTSRFGMVVDAVSEVVRMAAERIEADAGPLGDQAAGCACGIARIDDRTIVLLDPPKVVGSDHRGAPGAKPEAAGPRGGLGPELANDPS